MWNSLANNPLIQIFIALVVLILFSFDRNLLITQFLLGGRSNIWAITTVTIFFLSYIVLFLTILRGKLTIRDSHKGLLLVLFILAFYFLLHELIFRDSLVSAKYSIFLFLIGIALCLRYNFFFIFKILGYLGGIISLLLILQQAALYFATSGNINEFDIVIRGEEWGRPVVCDYVAPFGLGLIERCAVGPEFMIGDFIINRSIFFSTEPKYAASILLVTFSCLLISPARSLGKNLFIFFYFIAFLLILSASAFFILIFSFLILYLNFIGAKLYSAIVFLAPLYILPALIEFLLNLSGQEGYLFFRLFSASTDIGTGVFDISLFGESFGQSCEGQLCNDVGLLGNLTSTYGFIGFLLFWLFFYKITYSMFESFKDERVDKSLKLGMMILLNTYVIFNIYFFSDIFNMFGLFIILTIILLPTYLYENNSSELSTNNQVPEKVY